MKTSDDWLFLSDVFFRNSITTSLLVNPLAVDDEQDRSFKMCSVRILRLTVHIGLDPRCAGLSSHGKMKGPEQGDEFA